MSFASDIQAQLQAQHQALTAQQDSLKANADAQINAITAQLATDTGPLAAQLSTLDAQLQVLNQVVAQEQANTSAPVDAAPADQVAIDPNTGQPVTQ
ncbi:MAG: hypothetical protein JWO59_722 [Chloroflexi bacterium]|nr:hypothetical protein [Chloroflexota bacterium]